MSRQKFGPARVLCGVELIDLHFLCRLLKIVSTTCEKWRPSTPTTPPNKARGCTNHKLVAMKMAAIIGALPYNLEHAGLSPWLRANRSKQTEAQA